MAAQNILQKKVLQTWHHVADSKSCHRLLAREVLKGMQEASEAFDSVSVSLMHVVGLKADEMRRDGRISSVFITNHNIGGFDNFSRDKTFQSTSKSESDYEAKTSRVKLVSTVEKSVYLKNKASKCVAEIACRERQQIRNLMTVLKIIEASVQFKEQELSAKFNNHKKDLVIQHQQFKMEISDLLKKFKESRIHSLMLEHRHENVLRAVLRIQERIVMKIIQGLSNLETDFEDMLTELAASMCKPLISYLKDLKSMAGVNQAQALQGLVEQLESELAKQIDMLSSSVDHISKCMSALRTQFRVQDDKLNFVKRQLDFVHARQQKNDKMVSKVKKSLDKNLDNQKELGEFLERQSRLYDGLKVNLKEKEIQCCTLKQRQDSFLQKFIHQNIGEFDKKLSEIYLKCSELKRKAQVELTTVKPVRALSVFHLGPLPKLCICEKLYNNRQIVYLARHVQHVAPSTTYTHSEYNTYQPTISVNLLEKGEQEKNFWKREERGKGPHTACLIIPCTHSAEGEDTLLDQRGASLKILSEISERLFYQDGMPNPIFRLVCLELNNGKHNAHRPEVSSWSNRKPGSPFNISAISETDQTQRVNLSVQFHSPAQQPYKYTDMTPKNCSDALMKDILHLQSKLIAISNCLKRNESNILRSKGLIAALRECWEGSGGQKLKGNSVPDNHKENFVASLACRAGTCFESLSESLSRLKRSRIEVQATRTYEPCSVKKHKVGVDSHSKSKKSSRLNFNLSLLPEKRFEADASEELISDATSACNERELWQILELGE